MTETDQNSVTQPLLLIEGHEPEGGVDYVPAIEYALDGYAPDSDSWLHARSVFTEDLQEHGSVDAAVRMALHSIGEDPEVSPDVATTKFWDYMEGPSGPHARYGDVINDALDGCARDGASWLGGRDAFFDAIREGNDVDTALDHALSIASVDAESGVDDARERFHVGLARRESRESQREEARLADFRSQYDTAISGALDGYAHDGDTWRQGRDAFFEALIQGAGTDAALRCALAAGADGAETDPDAAAKKFWDYKEGPNGPHTQYGRAIEAALDSYAADSGSWIVGRDAFFEAMGEGYSQDAALARAFVAARDRAQSTPTEAKERFQAVLAGGDREDAVNIDPDGVGAVFKNLDKAAAHLGDAIELRRTPFGQGYSRHRLEPGAPNKIYPFGHRNVREQYTFIQGTMLGDMLSGRDAIVLFTMLKPDGQSVRIAIARTPSEYDPHKGGKELNGIGPFDKYLWTEVPVGQDGRPVRGAEPVRRYVGSNIDNIGVAPGLPLSTVAERDIEEVAYDRSRRPMKYSWSEASPRDPASPSRSLIPPGSQAWSVTAYS